MRVSMPVLLLTGMLSLRLGAQVAAPSAADQGESAPIERTHRSTAQLKLPPSRIAPTAPLSARERALQFLNRFTYGARPGEVERVSAQGPDAWFAQQLNPAAIPDAGVEHRLGDYPTLNLSAEQILTTFPDRGTVGLVAEGKKPYPTDPLQAGVFQVLVYRYNGEQENKNHPKAPLTDAELADQKKSDQAAAARVAGDLFALQKKERMAAFNAMPVPDRIAFANFAPNDQRNTLFADFGPKEREAIFAIQGGVGSPYRIGDELAQAHVVRSILSERQVQEVMTDFWFNHFNIYVGKDSDQWFTTPYERETIRPRALGKFRDLLLATAQSPAMLVYLDNWLSIGPNSVANGVDPKNPNAKRGSKGLNENYGREVMELHTVGVNGGYSQADVTHLAAMLTGWGVDRPNLGGPFVFDPKKHEPGTKDWFGYTIDDSGKVLRVPAGAGAMPAVDLARYPEGMRQGVTALSLLGASAKTAHFISRLVAQRFLADDPPAAVVDRMAAAFTGSDGDIKTVLLALVQSPEFNSHRYFRNKVKTPAEFVASAFRATATDPQNPGALVNLLAREFGQPLYKAVPPTGYYVTADVWMNTQALLARLNFADQLTHNRFANQKFDAAKVLALSLMSDRNAGAQSALVKVAASKVEGVSGAEVALRVLEGSLIGNEISPGTDGFIQGQLQQQPPANVTETLNLLTALLLGSPEFQLR